MRNELCCCLNVALIPYLKQESYLCSKAGIGNRFKSFKRIQLNLATVLQIETREESFALDSIPFSV